MNSEINNYKEVEFFCSNLFPQIQQEFYKQPDMAFESKIYDLATIIKGKTNDLFSYVNYFQQIYECNSSNHSLLLNYFKNSQTILINQVIFILKSSKQSSFNLENLLKEKLKWNEQISSKIIVQESDYNEVFMQLNEAKKNQDINELLDEENSQNLQAAKEKNSLENEVEAEEKKLATLLDAKKIIEAEIAELSQNNENNFVKTSNPIRLDSNKNSFEERIDLFEEILEKFYTEDKEIEFESETILSLETEANKESYASEANEEQEFELFLVFEPKIPSKNFLKQIEACFACAVKKKADIFIFGKNKLLKLNDVAQLDEELLEKTKLDAIIKELENTEFSNSFEEATEFIFISYLSKKYENFNLKIVDSLLENKKFEEIAEKYLLFYENKKNEAKPFIGNVTELSDKFDELFKKLNGSKYTNTSSVNYYYFVFNSKESDLEKAKNLFAYLNPVEDQLSHTLNLYKSSEITENTESAFIEYLFEKNLEILKEFQEKFSIQLEDNEESFISIFFDYNHKLLFKENFFKSDLEHLYSFFEKIEESILLELNENVSANKSNELDYESQDNEKLIEIRKNKEKENSQEIHDTEKLLQNLCYREENSQANLQAPEKTKSRDVLEAEELESCVDQLRDLMAIEASIIWISNLITDLLNELLIYLEEEEKFLEKEAKCLEDEEELETGVEENFIEFFLLNYPNLTEEFAEKFDLAYENTNQIKNCMY